MYICSIICSILKFEILAVKITCIRKDGGNHENPYVAISRLGWINESTDTKGESSRLEMYNFVVNEKGTAYVTDYYGNKANLIGAISLKRNKYVKTVADNFTTDNLLKLNECN